MIAVTGCAGWVGGYVVRELASRSQAAFGDVDERGQRRLDLTSDASVARFVEGAVAAGADSLIHCAGRAHRMGGDSAAGRREMFEINHEGTTRLAEQAASRGIRRMVFVSTIKVSGERTTGKPFDGTEPPNPSDAYSESKLAAENQIGLIARQSGMEYMVIRPPIMFGAGVKANIRSLASAVLRGRVLPFGSITLNRRSVAGVRNFADALIRSSDMTLPVVTGAVYAFADADPVSTADLIRRIATAAGRKARNLPVPIAVLRSAGLLTRRSTTISRLLDSLEVDGSRLYKSLGWEPRYAIADELRAMVDEIRASVSASSAGRATLNIT